MDAGPGRQASNLPVQSSSFVGRDRELADLDRFLETTRLLTLTGPGGCGKTRLGLQLAVASAEKFAEGVCFVPLAPLRDPELVPSSIAQNLGLQDTGDRPLRERLVSHLRSRKLLLLLDNFEHLLAAARTVAELLEQTDAVRIVVSSRAPLRIRGEQEYPVPPLRLPIEGAPADSIATTDSVRLFVERAREALPDFGLNDANSASVAAIARRLDGLPLAIELAAARVRLLSPEAMLPRLERSLALLTTGARDLPDRQRTLRSTIAWSYDLLSDEGRMLLAACSVFRGGIDLDAVESVCSELPLGSSVLEGLEELVEQSLLRSLPSDRPRFLMLETIREFASERLEETPLASAIKDAHASAFLALAETARPELTGPREKEWLDRLEREHNNMRAAHDRFLDTEPARALHLVALLGPFWTVRGHFSEARALIASALDASEEPSTDRVTALYTAGNLAIDQADYASAFEWLENAVQLATEIGDERGESWARLYLARATIASEQTGAVHENLDRGRQLAQAADDRPAIALGCLYAGLEMLFTARPAEAADLFQQFADVSRSLGHRSMTARALQIGAHALVDLGELGKARRSVEEGLPTSIELQDRFVLQIALTALAGIAFKSARPARAIKLAGAAQGYCDLWEVGMPAVLQTRLEAWMAPARKLVGAGWERLYTAGKQMSLEEAIAYALSDAPEDSTAAGRGAALTRREQEVARLAATGLTNRDIAARLHLSVRTVEVHVDHVLTKLGFNNRTQLAAWAYEEKLLPEIT